MTIDIRQVARMAKRIAVMREATDVMVEDVIAKQAARISVLEHALDEVGHWIHNHGCADDQPILTDIDKLLRPDPTPESAR